MGASRLAMALWEVWVALWVSGLYVSINVTNINVLGYKHFRFPYVLALWHMLLASASARMVMNVLAVRQPVCHWGPGTATCCLRATGPAGGMPACMNASHARFPPLIPPSEKTA